MTKTFDLADGESFAFERRDPLRMFRAAFGAAPYGVIVAREDGTILFANTVVCTTFAYADDAIVGQSLARLLPESFPPFGVEQSTDFWTSLRTRQLGVDGTVTGLRKDGMQVPLEVVLNALVQGESRYLVASIVDVTDRLNLEARLTAATQEHLGFQRLVADIASSFGGVEPGGLNDLIVDSLRQIAQALQLDRAVLWRRSSGEPLAHQILSWTSTPGAAPQPFPIASIPHVIAKLEAGEACAFGRLDDLADPIDRDTFGQRGIRCGAVIPLIDDRTGEGDLGAIEFTSTTREHAWSPAIIERLRLVAGVVSQAFAQARSHRALQQALDEIKLLRDRIPAQNAEANRDGRAPRTSGLIVADSSAMKRILAQAEQVATTPATVLLLGETGSGKEVMAQAIHDWSPRHQRQMVRVSCAAIPTALIESELFGRERGAYTGALSRQIGRFEAANQSTLFLDEVGELPMEVQVKLLRVLQERTIERLGSTQPIKVDVRIIAATNRNLEEAVEEKTFREDLFYRLNVFPIVVPPLRERVEDIPGLVWSFIDEFSRMFGKTIESVAKDSMQELQRYPWPGNVRELRNVIERAVIISTSRQLVVPAPRPPARMPQNAMTLNALEIEHIRNVLESTNWRVRGRGGAAERLGLKPTTLESRMARLGITRKRAT